MPDILATFIVSTGTALLSGVTVAYFTNKFSARRSTEEKIWELRRATYGLILAELAAAELILEELDRYILLNPASNPNDILNGFHIRPGFHLNTARKAYTDSYLILSDCFIKLFEGFLLSFDNVDDLSPSEEYKIFSAAIREGRPKLLQQARSEMPLRGGVRDGVRRRMPWRRA